LEKTIPVLMAGELMDVAAFQAVTPHQTRAYSVV
jgi:hypothetical protein